MANSATYSRSFRPLGMSFDVAQTVSFELGIPWSVTLAAAKEGALTTRTDNDTGELTMDAGHGITTGARLDVYWTGGSRRGMTVGTVSTNQVPIDGGAGDNLPDDETDITAMVPTEEAVVVTGDDVVGIAASCPQGGTVVFADSSNAELFARVLTTSASGYVYSEADGGDNPLAGESLAKVFLSHGNSSQSSEVTGVVLYN